MYRYNNAGFSPQTIWLIILVILVPLAIHMLIWKHRNEQMDMANDDYQRAVDDATKAIREANQSLSSLRKMAELSPVELQNIENLRLEMQKYNRLYARAKEEKARANRMYNAAYNAYSDGVHKQNLFLGGANNLTVFSLRKRERELRNIRISISLDDPTMVIAKATCLLEARRMMDAGRQVDLSPACKTV